MCVYVCVITFSSSLQTSVIFRSTIIISQKPGNQGPSNFVFFAGESNLSM